MTLGESLTCTELLDAIRAGGDIDIIRKGGVELVRADCLGPYDTVPRVLSPTRPFMGVTRQARTDASVGRNP